MKNQLIGALVAALLLFIWQFLSWGVFNLHGSAMQYTANQDAILEALNAANLEEGQYFIPRAPEGASEDEQQLMRTEHEGQPWALVSYHTSLEDRMGFNLLRGFVINLVAAFLLVWLLGKMANPDMKTCLMGSIAVGLIGYFTINYLNAIWFESDTIPYLIDAVVSWGLVGLWLGWWIPGRVNT